MHVQEVIKGCCNIRKCKVQQIQTQQPWWQDLDDVILQLRDANGVYNRETNQFFNHSGLNNNQK